MKKATLSTKNQITLPIEDVRWMGAEKQLVVERQELPGGLKGLLILPVPNRLSDQYRGIHQSVWESVGSVGYIKGMRKKEWKI